MVRLLAKHLPPRVASSFLLLLLVFPACNDSNLHVVQAGNLGAVDGGQLPRLLVVAALRANQVTSRAAGVAE